MWRLLEAARARGAASDWLMRSTVPLIHSYSGIKSCDLR